MIRIRFALTGRSSCSVIGVHMCNAARAYATESAKKKTTRDPFIKYSHVRQNRILEKLSENVYRYTDGRRLRLVGAALVERLPLVMPPLSDVEREYLELEEQLEEEMDMDGGEEIPLMPDFVTNAMSSKKKRNLAASSSESEEARELREARAAAAGQDETLAQYAAFEPAPLITDDDRANNTKSLNRKLDHSLYLIVKRQHPQYGNVWQFPNTPFDEVDFTMRVTAQRAVYELCGDSLELWWTGHAPMCHAVSSIPPESASGEFDGDVSFFYATQFLDGEFVVNNDANVDDFAWLTRDELAAYLEPQLYTEVSSVLL